MATCRHRALVLGTAATLALAVLALPAMARREPPAAASVDWRRHIQRVDDALAVQNVKAAVEAWREAYGAALQSLRWEGMVEVGDTYLQIGDWLDFRRAFVGDSRASYLVALFRARQERSLDGILRSAEAFAALGDRDIAERCLQLAEHLVAQGPDPEARARVSAFAERWAGRLLAVGEQSR